MPTQPPANPNLPTPPAFGSSPSPAPLATPPPRTGRRLAAFSVKADRIRFYSNRFIVGAEGNVLVVLGDGTHVGCDTFSMDLRLNRFVAAGHVRLVAGGKETHGAAFAEFFDFDRAYFVPITTEPDRWTYTAGDYARPLLGREMPGDVFFLPKLTGERAFLTARRAVIDPRESVRFTPASLNFGLTDVTFPSYFLDFSRNPNFAQNSLSGADVDGPYDFAGGEHALATLHVRYDNINKLYSSYEQHQFSNNHYVVFSVNPVTRPGKLYNVVAYDRISPAVQMQALWQEFTFQHSFRQPLTASAFVGLQLTTALRQSFLQLSTTSYYQSLLAQPEKQSGGYYYGDISHLWIPDHPSGANLVWSGFRHSLNRRLPVSYQLRSSIGLNHNGISKLNQNSGLLSLGGVKYDTVWDHGVGLTLLTDPITILHDRTGRRRDTYFVATFDKQRTWYSAPHHIDVTSTTLSLTKVIDPQHLTALLSYTNLNIADFYGAYQLYVYPSYAPVSQANGQRYPGYRAFRGLSDSRSFTQQLVFTPSPALTAAVAMRENDDFPVPIPGLPQTMGNVISFNNYGPSPYQLTLDLRFRVNSLLYLDVGRSYFFGFGRFQRWSPSFLIQVEK